MITKPAPTGQQAGVRPIVFFLDDGQISTPVLLPIRPEDLSRTEPSRVTVHQTQGRDITGWVDNFGAGLPSVTISGHTGWRYSDGTGRDGWGSFQDLNELVAHQYHDAKQAAIDNGTDPASVKLIFADALDDFAWSVVPTQFVLRRSRSRPLLFQYNITLQAVDTSIDVPDYTVPNYGNSGLGRSSLSDATDAIRTDMDGLVFPAGTIPATTSSILDGFVQLSTEIFDVVNSTISKFDNYLTGATNAALSIASDLAKVGTNIFRTISAVANIPATVMARASRIAAAYNAVACIFQNSLRPRVPYEEYSDLYGTSNCSSTTGGSTASIYAGQNVFSLMVAQGAAVTVTSAAMSSITAVKNADPVLAPLPIQEVERNAAVIVSGVSA